MSIPTRSNKKKKQLGRTFRAQWQVQLMVLCGMAALILFCYVPIGWNIIAFQDFKIIQGITGSQWVGLKHFRAFLVDDTFWMAMRNTLGMTAVKFIPNTLAPIAFAVIMSELPYPKMKKATQTLTYLPHFLSYVVVATLVNIILGPRGMVNQVLAGLGASQISFIDNADTFWGLSTWLDIWKETGWNSILYLAAISGVGPELYEAAKVDGAGRFKRIWHVTLPAIRWTFMMLLILNMGNLLSGGPVGSNFSQSRLIGNAFNYSRSYIVDTYSLELGMNNMRYSFATAISIFQSIISVTLLLITNTITRKTTGESLF